MVVLETKALKKIYKLGQVEVKALNGIDFVVRKGEFVAIMGASGSGKSTLLNILGALDVPSHGEVTLGGQPLALLRDSQLTLVRRRMIGFIFQFYNLLPTLTAEENIALPLLIDGQSPQKHRQKIEQLLNLVGLMARRTHKPDQLSGGEQQRVAIARAFVNDPEIVLADEPTGNLDSRTGTAILDLLRSVCTELQATTIMVTHDPRAASYADRVVFLKDGRIMGELGSADNGHGRLDIEAILEKVSSLEEAVA